MEMITKSVEIRAIRGQKNRCAAARDFGQKENNHFI
jgi:hypothetical protein